VWFPHNHLSDEEAGEVYEALADGDSEDLAAHAAVADFYAELTQKHPEIDDVPEGRIDDTDYCPWSCELDHSEGHLIMCCVWSKAEYVYDLVKGLALKHGLAMYDPQEGHVTYPSAA